MIIVGACTPKAEIELSFDTDCIEIGPEGGVRTIAVTVGEDWVARTNEPWIAFSPANGKASEKCQIIIDSTLVFEQREDVVKIQTASGGLQLGYFFPISHLSPPRSSDKILFLQTYCSLVEKDLASSLNNLVLKRCV